MHEYLRIEIDGYPATTFDECARVVGYDFKAG
jgi:hypothetical protein